MYYEYDSCVYCVLKKSTAPAVLLFQKEHKDHLIQQGKCD
jgi:hypothetical protein